MSTSPGFSVVVGPGLFQELQRKDPDPVQGCDYSRKGREYISDQEVKPAHAMNGNRRPICGFSRRARRNMARRVHGHPGKFNAWQTLTVPDDVLWESTGYGASRFLTLEERMEEAKRFLKNFDGRVRYEYPGVSWVWRMEIKRRTVHSALSGEWVFHFHILWALSFANCLLDFAPFAKRMVQMWIDVLGTKHPKAFFTHYEARKKGKLAWEWLGDEPGRVTAYLSKYVGKSDEESQYEFETGRLWGVKGVPLKKMQRHAELPLTDKEKSFFCELLRGDLQSSFIAARSERLRRLRVEATKRRWSEARVESEISLWWSAEEKKLLRLEEWTTNQIFRYFRTHFFMDRGKLLDFIWIAKCQAENCPF